MGPLQVLDPASLAIVEQLNAAQKQAALHNEGPLVVFAGAGSGKTRIITARIALLVAAGVRPSQILAVTFTNKAAKEMRERVESLSPYGRLVHIATFHAACARWLREFAAQLGFQSDFTIYDDKDALTALKGVLQELAIKDDQHGPQDYKHAIHRAKVRGWLPSDAERVQEQYRRTFPPGWVAVYRRYQEYLANCNAMDFNDLLMNMLLLLRNNHDVRALLQKRYRYILVDEYQDTNPTQFALISYLLSPEKNLFVVGDDDQSIYSWRGADPANIIEFRSHFAGALEVRLEQNYRCSGNIVQAAGHLIAHNKVRAEKTLWTDNEAGEPIAFELVYDGESEGLTLVDHIKNEEEHYPFHATAVFYRTNAQSRQIEDSLRRQKVPYRLYGALRFYDRAEIKDVLAYFRLVVNKHDDIAFKRVLNTPPRGIGKTALSQLEELARREDSSLMVTAQKLAAGGSQLRLAAKIKQFVTCMEEFTAAMAANPLGEVLPLLLKIIAYKDYLDKKFPEQVSDKMANIHELGTVLAEYGEAKPEASLGDWLQEVSLNESDKQEDSNGVTLMTLHSAKGLEFPRVYIVGVEDGLIPHSNSMDEEVDLEEERRLFYVGLTRARSKVTLLAARKRRVYNQWMANPPSRFLKELPNAVLVQGKALAQRQAPPRQSLAYDYRDSQLAASGPGLKEGCFVSHPTFGKGVISEVAEDFGVWKAVVEFREFGKRKIAVHHLKQIAYLD